MIKPVRQEDSMGCGIACTAFVTGKSYQETKNELFKNRKKASKRGYLCKEMVYALKKARLTYTYHYLKHQLKYQNSTIVFIKRSKRFPYGHYLVKTSKGWMDPWINLDTDKDVRNSRAGFRKRLPGKASYIILPVFGVKFS